MSPVNGMEVVRVRDDGEIVLNTLYYTMAVLVQLGLVPEGALA
jgi:hypothetical protein